MSKIEGLGRSREALGALLDALGALLEALGTSKGQGQSTGQGLWAGQRLSKALGHRSKGLLRRKQRTKSLPRPEAPTGNLWTDK